MTTVHFCLESFDPRRGGMEESALRIVDALADEPDLRFVAYVTGGTKSRARPPHLARLVDIAPAIDALTAGAGITRAQLSQPRRSRLEALLVRNAVREDLVAHPDHRHIVLSFYLSTAGFIGQLVASELKLPHIACSRGSDLGHNLFMSDRIGVLEYVLKRATLVVTTSKEHARYARDLGGRERGIKTVYNGLPDHVRPRWTRRPNSRVRLVSAGGYCFKKGTATLIAAATQLIDEGLPVDLAIVGRNAIGRWKEIRQNCATRYGDRIALGSVVDREAVESLLLGGDIYCSASLSEGCSNALTLALGLGLPIVGTRTGALLDFADGLDHIALVTPGDPVAFTDALRTMVNRILTDRLSVDPTRVGVVVARLSRAREQSEWKAILHAHYPSGNRAFLT